MRCESRGRIVTEKEKSETGALPRKRGESEEKVEKFDAQAHAAATKLGNYS
jgi:hypothetical protein